MLSRFLRRTETVKGDGFDSQPLARVVSVKGTVLDKYSKCRTESRSSLLIRVNGSNNVVEQLTNSIDKNQVESKSHKVNTAGSGNVSGTYRPRNLYKQQWGKSPHNIFAEFYSLVAQR